MGGADTHVSARDDAEHQISNPAQTKIRTAVDIFWISLCMCIIFTCSCCPEPQAIVAVVFMSLNYPPPLNQSCKRTRARARRPVGNADLGARHAPRGRQPALHASSISAAKRFAFIPPLTESPAVPP